MNVEIPFRLINLQELTDLLITENYEIEITSYPFKTGSSMSM